MPKATRRQTKRAADPPRGAENRWTFFTNHAHVLIVLQSDPTLVLREVASRVGITERGVQRIVQELEDAGFLTRERVGRRNRYKLSPKGALRHPIESHCTVEQLLGLIEENRPKA